MNVFATPGNPVPPNPIVSVVQTSDGIRLRAARWQARTGQARTGQARVEQARSAGERSEEARAGRGTVVVALGRSEFIESYFEVVTALVARGFEVVVFDWRGQGLSDRLLEARHRGHVSSFAAYQRDLLALEAQILRVFAPRPWFALGHSMGAAILLDQAHRGTSPFERLVLSAPMIDIALRHRTAKRLAIRAMDLAGLGGRFVPGGGQRPLFTRQFEGNVMTTDRKQYDRLSAVIGQLPELTVGSPTVRWLTSAFDLMDRFRDPRFSVETTVPILMITAGADRIVDTAAAERFAIRLRAGRCITLPAARHQLVMERDSVAAQFWAAFDAFIPGETAQAMRASAVPPARSPPSGLLRRLAGRLPQLAVGRRRVSGAS